MPTSSAIQIVNDANGTAHAFLLEEGRIWQGVWNAEAARWDKGTIVPGAFGGEKLQALLLPQFWTTASNGGTTATAWDPALVLAYRVGQGSGAEIQASFGRWDALGQLTWTAPVRLTDDQSGDRQFALSAGENRTLNLVVQKQVGATPVNAVLDALATTAANDPAALRDQLTASLQSTAPDSDLYVNRYRIDSTGTQLEQLVSTSVPGGQWQAITNAANPLEPAPITARLSRPAVSLSGSTQLVRSLLYPKQQTQPLPAQSLLSDQGAALAPATPTFTAAAAPVGSLFSPVVAPSYLRLDLTGPVGSALDIGLKEDSVYRWIYQAARDSQTTVKTKTLVSSVDQILKDNGQILGSGNVDVIVNGVSAADEVGLGLDAATRQKLLNRVNNFYGKNPNKLAETVIVSSSDATAESVVNLRLQGGIGLVQGGNSALESFSFAKFVLGKGTDTEQVRGGGGGSQADTKLIFPPRVGNDLLRRFVVKDTTKAELREFQVERQTLANQRGLLIAKTSNYGVGGLVGSKYSYGSSDRASLKSLVTKESVSLDGLRRTRSIQGQWLKEQIIVGSSGYYWEQLFSDPARSLPAYAGIVGLATGGVAAGLTLWAGSTGLRGGGSLRFAESSNPVPLGSRQGQVSNALVGLTGLASAAAVPVALALGSQPLQARYSRGVQFEGRISGSSLYRGIVGFDLNLGDRLYTQDEYVNFGPNGGFFSKIGNQFYFDVGAQLVGGMRVPLISFYDDLIFPNQATTEQGGAPGVEAPPSGFPVNVDFTADGAYPVTYLPAAGSPLFAGPPLISPEDARTFLLGDAEVNRLRLLTLGSTATPGPASPVQIQLEAQGSGLNPGTYQAVRILGVPLLEGGYATVDVTVDGSGQVSALSNLQGADYLSLPEKSPLSGVFYLPLDVYQVDPSLGRAMAPLFGAVRFQPPVLSIPASSSGGSGLSNRRLSSFDRVAVVAGGSGYQRLTQLQAGEPLSAEVPASNDNTAYTYTAVPVSLLRGGELVPLLGHDEANPATATVHLAGGSIRRIDLDQTLYIPEAATSSADAYSLALTLPAGISPLSQASLTLSPSSVELNNLVEESDFSAQPGAVDTGVYIAAGQASQLALDSADGYRRLQNRVAYTSLDANGKAFTVYLNSSGQSFATASQLTNEQIVTGNAPEFSFANHPTSISISGGKNDQLKGDTLVMWVEAGDPLIPYSSTDGNSNYQAYLTAAYGNQALNYRVAINGSATNWQKPDAATLYRPDNAIISDLQLFNVPDPRSGELRTLLVWAEISIDAIKGLVDAFGSGLSLPATIKSTWINADSDTINWNDLSEEVVTIPWNQDTSVGMGIADLSLASQTLKRADGTVLQTPLISWSQSVRTPYQEAVLKDQPSIYLPMAGLAPGESSLNLGTASPTLSTTFASSSGLDFNVPGALTVEQTTAVRNSDGTGVLSTDLGSFSELSLGLISQIPSASLPTPPAPDPAAPPTPSLPYAIEFWTQLQPGSNPEGAGLVAMGQPSAAAVGAASLPQGWLLQSSFQVDRISVSDAASLGLINPSEIPAGQGDALYGWSWSLQADGANSTAMNGDGGSNLYANAVTLANLNAGQAIAGVDAFLGSYGLTAAQLSGLNGTPANTMALVPSTSLVFTDFLDPQSQRPTSALNGVAIDPSTTLLNQGFISAADAAANANLNGMLSSLWRYQQATGEVKVVFGADPKAAPQPAAATPDPLSPESYGGYALDFALWGGPAVSVNGSGQVVFDVSRDLALTAPADSDLRDGSWRYVAVSYAPEYVDVQADGTTVQVPTDRGTASLFIDGQLVSSSPVSGVYLPLNPNGQAQLLTRNAGGAIDHVAFYDAAINALNPNPPGSDLWPKLTAKDALAELEALGVSALPGSPDPGQIPGAVTAHWLARNVNPLGALQATYTSSYRLSADGNTWSWSEASGLNPVLAPELTTLSASRGGSPSDALRLSISGDDWADLLSSASSSRGFNPSGQELLSVSVTLTDSNTGSRTIQLSAEQVLVGSQTIAALQPRSTDPASRNDPAGPQLHYTVLNEEPELTLLIPRADLPSPATTTAKVQLSFRSQDSASPSDVVVSTVNPLAFQQLALADQAAQTGFVPPDTLQQLRDSNQALATAAVLEAAPLQLKNIDSGVTFRSEATAAAADDASSSVPAQSFGTSQVAGRYRLEGDAAALERGWIAIAQTITSNAPSNLAGRVWVNYSGLRPVDPDAAGNPSVPVEQAPSTWLNALARSNFDPQTPNLPLLNDGRYPSGSGGLLIEADETLGINANLGQVMLNADLDGDGNEELIIAAPNASGGGCVYIIQGDWIAANLNSVPLSLDLANPTAYGPDVVTILRPGASSSNPQNPGKGDRVSFAGFGTALAVDPASGKLWIGAPQYVRELPQRPDQTELEALVAIGALYSFDYKNQRTAPSLTLAPVVLGAAGSQTVPGSGVNSRITSYWGAQLGTALAISADGQLAVSAPGIPAAQEFYGTDELIQQTVSGKVDASQRSNWGSLYRAGFATKPADAAAISQLNGTDRKALTRVDGQAWQPGSANVRRLRTFIENNPDITIASPTLSYNQALQTDAVGAVFLLDQAESLSQLAAGGNATQLWAEDVAASGGATFYGSNVVNTLGGTGFGSSLSFADLANLNRDQLVIGAASSSGTGAVLAIDPGRFVSGSPDLAIADQPNSYLAYQVAFLNLLGSQNLDQFGRRLVALGDVNNDRYGDVLATAPNARGGAGSGYVIFGSDQLLDPSRPAQLLGSVAPGSIGALQGPAGVVQAPILEELGTGSAGQAGAGVYGRGDVDGDGYADVLLGSGGSGSATVTWGKPFLSAIDNLALEKLSSSNGFLLDGLATRQQGSLRSVGDFNADGYDDFISLQRGPALTTVRLELGAAPQDLLAIYPYNFYSFTVSNDTEVVPIGDSNGDGFADIALFIDQSYSVANRGAGSSTGILYGRSSDRLPIGSGFGLLTPDGAPLPERNVVGGLSDATPAFLTVGTTIYSVVKGFGDTDSVWFNQSRDGGGSWDAWTNLTDLQPSLRTASGHGPALAWVDGRLVLGLRDPQGQISLSSWDPSSEDLSSWTAASTPLIDGQPIRSSQTPQLVAAGLNLALLWVEAGGELRSSTSTDPFNSGSWQPAQSLQERLSDGSSRALRSLTAPSLASLGDGLVALAVAEDDPATAPGAISRIRVLTSLPDSLRWAEASRFEASGAPPAGGPSLATTDTGLALTYGTAAQGVVLQRLDLLDLDGTSLNQAGPLEPLIQQTWQATSLKGLSSPYGTVPLVVSGTLLLGNVRADAQNGQIWLNAIAAPQRADSSVWIDSSVQLSDGNGGWLVQQQAGPDHPVTFGVLDPGWQNPNSGLSPWAPSFAELDGVLYSAVRGWKSDGTNKQLYWNRSFDDGLTWNGWQKLPGDMTSDRPPTIAAYDGTLYLVYIGQDSSQTLNLTRLDNADANQWASQIQVRAGISGASNQTAEFATLLDEGDQLALYYVGSGKNELYSTSSTDPYNPGKFTTSTLIQYSNGNQTASGPLAATRLNGQTYLAYQGGTYQTKNLPGPSNQIFLTSGKVDDKSWTLLSGVPQPGSASHTGVGLTANSNGLVLSYSDVIDARNVVSLQQGTGSANSWSFAPYAVLERPEDSVPRNDGANSLYARSGSDRVLVATIDSSANEAINSAWVRPLPPSLVLTPEQTRSTLTPVGDLTGDGYADALITAANVVQQAPGGGTPQLQTGVRLLSGAPSSAAFGTANDVTAKRQTLQLAPAFALSAAAPSTAPTAAAGSPTGLPQLTVAATAFGERSRIITSAASQSLANFTASSSNPASLFSLFQGASQAAQSLPSPSLWGRPQLRSSSFGDLNGDGRPDRLAAGGLDGVQTASGALGYALWDIRAAGDANGNGVDDVLLALVPRGPAYQPQPDGSPSFIQPVLVDGSLFKVDTTTDTFSLDSLRAPLNPYTQAEVVDLNSTSSKDYLPPLQAWIDPILGFVPGTLTGATAVDASGPGEASASGPQMVVDELGREFLVYTGGTSGASVLASQLRLAYRRADDSWASSDIPLGGRTISAVTPSAAFYGGRLYVTYADQNGRVWISHTSNPITPDSDPSQWSWNAYAVSINGSPVSTLISPTLVANHGVLTLIVPGAKPPDKTLGIPTEGQQIYLASSNNPEAGDKSAWGSGFDATTNRFSGAASPLQVQTSPGGQPQLAYTGVPVVATVFQGQTVLAYQSMQPAQKAVVLATEPLAAGGAGANPVYALKTTGIADVNGLSLTTDQALLYLAHADSESDTVGSGNQQTIVYSSKAYLSGFAPGKGFATNAANWDEQSANPIGNVGTLPSYVDSGSGGKTRTIRDQGYRFPTFFGVTMSQGSLMGTWFKPGSGTSVQAADLNTSVSAPAQVSLAGYSIDGGSDINGDGFRDLLVSDPSDPSRAVDNQYALFGGDWLNIATRVGTSGDDVIAGTPLADVIYTLSGADEVRSNGGRDVILSADGDDRLAIRDNRFLRIDAGGGFDQLLLEGLLAQAYDFRLNVPEPEYFPGTRLQNVELIDSRDFGANTLIFDAAAVSAFNANRFLFLTPDASDSIWLTSDFQRNANFDTRFGGRLWAAFTAAPETVTPSQASPAVVYVLNPEPLNPGWLDVDASGPTAPGLHIQKPGAAMPAAARDDALAARRAPADAPGEGAAPASSQGTTTLFGRGLAVTALSRSSRDGFSAFRLSRQDPAGRQVVTYATSPQNSRASLGADVLHAAGVVVFEPGELEKLVLVPWVAGAFVDRRGSSLSLDVRELAPRAQQELHVLLESLPDPVSGDRPVFSGIAFETDPRTERARIRLRADTNTPGDSDLRLRVAVRPTADALVPSRSQEVELRDFNPQASFTLPVDSLLRLPLDHDARRNAQVSASLELDLNAAADQARVALLGPQLVAPTTIELIDGQQLRFQQDAPLTNWRSDTGAGLVTFALTAGQTRRTLLSDASGGTPGSLNADRVNDPGAATGWRSTEGLAVGSRAASSGVDLSGRVWTPTASRDGVDLALRSLTINGNQVTASFEDGVTGVFWQGTGTPPSVIPVAASLEVSRLAAYDNGIAFYKVDDITGRVDGLAPGDAGYLPLALRRAEAQGLVLRAEQLPAFGETALLRSLPFNALDRYGVLLLPDGDASRMVSSFAAANPGGAAQMISLSRSAEAVVLGIEDVVGASSDLDFNDMTLTLRNVNLPLF